MTHYKSHPSGIEAIEITQYESFLRGNILKYVLRAPYKGAELEDLEKAAEYLQWEIERVKEEQFWAKFDADNTDNIRDRLEKDFVQTGNKVAKHLEEVGKMRKEWDDLVFPDKCQECSGNCKVC